MVIFHSYVSLPEGTDYLTKTYKNNCWTGKEQVHFQLGATKTIKNTAALQRDLHECKIYVLDL